MSVQRWARWWTVAAGVSLVAIGSAVGAFAASTPAPVKTRVLIVGGSAAFGWHDKTGMGYIERGLKSWSRNPAGLMFQNQAIPGATVNNPIIHKHYLRWLKASPKIVVLGWGLLNDLRVGTPWSEILSKIRQEALEALAAGAVVFVVTPPATTTTFTVNRGGENALVAAVIRTVSAINSRNLYVFDVLTREESWLLQHHQSVLGYMQGKWDPNTKGHILAGSLLASELKAELPQGSVGWIKPAVQLEPRSAKPGSPA